MNNQNSNQNEQWKLLVLLLKEIAESKAITHASIAEKTGFHRSNVSRFFALKHRPDLHIFLEIAKAIKVNFFFEDQENKTDLNISFEKAMEALGRRVDKLPRN